MSDTVPPDDLPTPNVTIQLLGRARQGDDRALEDLVERFQERLLRIVRLHLGPRLRQHIESMDVVQAANAIVIQRLADVKTEEPRAVLAWMTKIVINQIRAAYDHHHAAKRDVDRLEALAPTQGVDAQSPLTAPPERAEKVELRQLLDSAVDTLQEDQRQVVLLRDYCGHDWDDIAAELGRSLGAARQLHQRAWSKIRESLTGLLRDSE